MSKPNTFFLGLFLVLLALPLTAQLEIVTDRVGVGRVPLLSATFEMANLTHQQYGGFFTNRLNNNATAYSLYVDTYKPRGTA